MAIDEFDRHDAPGYARWLRDRAVANRKIADLPREEWPYRPDVLSHWAYRFDQGAELIDGLASDCRELMAERESLNTKVCELITQRQQSEHERDAAVDHVAHLAGAIVGYVRARRDGLGEVAHWWWELQQIANEIAAPRVVSGASIAGVSPSPAPLAPQSIESLRDYAVLDGERLQSLWAEIDRLRRQLYLLQNERDNLADNVHERDTRSAPDVGDGT